MRWSLGHVTLLPGEFQSTHKFFLPIGLTAPGEFTLNLAPKFLVFSAFFFAQNGIRLEQCMDRRNILHCD